jgi:hypothetical protein
LHGTRCGGARIANPFLALVAANDLRSLHGSAVLVDCFARSRELYRRAVELGEQFILLDGRTNSLAT